MYKIIRLSDKDIVEKTATLEEAEKKIIFYDTEESPHKIELDDPKSEYYFKD